MTMQTTLAAASDFWQRLGDETGRYFQLALGYGEPGYGDAPMVVLGDYWCRCDRTGDTHNDGSSRLHDLIETHYPRTAEIMASAGVECVWEDEWAVDESGRAWRTSADSYSWQPSAIYTEDGELLTTDDDIETWLEWATERPTERCLLSTVCSESDLIAAGFSQWEYDGQPAYESGWHPGQTDSPEGIHAAAAAALGDDETIVFHLGETSQFYVRFTCWHRPSDESDLD